MYLQYSEASLGSEAGLAYHPAAAAEVPAAAAARMSWYPLRSAPAAAAAWPYWDGKDPAANPAAADIPCMYEDETEAAAAAAAAEDDEEEECGGGGAGAAAVVIAAEGEAVEDEDGGRR